MEQIAPGTQEMWEFQHIQVSIEDTSIHECLWGVIAQLFCIVLWYYILGDCIYVIGFIYYVVIYQL